MEISEGKTAVLSLTISKPRQVTWMKDLDPVPRYSKKFQVCISEDNLVHQLHILNALADDDSGEYTAVVTDGLYGSISSSCKINVKGTIYVCFSCQ